MDTRHDYLGRIVTTGDGLWPVVVSDFLQSALGPPAVRTRYTTFVHGRLNERNKSFGGNVLNTSHANTSDAAVMTIDFVSVSRPETPASTPPKYVSSTSTSPERRSLPDRITWHDEACEARPMPSGSCCSPQRIDAVFLGRHVPHRLQPHP